MGIGARLDPSKTCIRAMIVLALALVACTPSKTPDQQFVERLHTCGKYIPNTNTGAPYECRLHMVQEYCAQVMNSGASSWNSFDSCMGANFSR